MPIHLLGNGVNICVKKNDTITNIHTFYFLLFYISILLAFPPSTKCLSHLCLCRYYVYKNSLAIYIRTALYLKYGGNGMTLFVYVVYNFNFCVFSLFIDVNHLLFLFSPTGVNAFVVLELNVFF